MNYDTDTFQLFKLKTSKLLLGISRLWNRSFSKCHLSKQFLKTHLVYTSRRIYRRCLSTLPNSFLFLGRWRMPFATYAKFFRFFTSRHSQQNFHKPAYVNNTDVLRNSYEYSVSNNNWLIFMFFDIIYGWFKPCTRLDGSMFVSGKRSYAFKQIYCALQSNFKSKYCKNSM